MINKINLTNNIDIELKNTSKVSTAVHDWMHQKEFRAFIRYTGNGWFEKINQALISGVCKDFSIKSDIEDLDKLFATLPIQLQNTKPVEVFRGIEIYDDISTFFQNNPEGKIYTNKGFTSTSKNEQVARRFTGTNGIVFHITIPKNSCIIDDTKLPSHVRAFANEEEVLLPRNAQFRVLSYDPKRKIAKMEYIGQKLPLEMPKSNYEIFGSDILSVYNGISINKIKDNNFDFTPQEKFNKLNY